MTDGPQLPANCALRGHLLSRPITDPIDNDQVPGRRTAVRDPFSHGSHPSDLALGIPLTASALIALTLTALAPMSGSDRFWFTSGVSDSYHVDGRYSVRSSQRSIDPAG